MHLRKEDGQLGGSMTLHSRILKSVYMYQVPTRTTTLKLSTDICTVDYVHILARISFFLARPLDPTATDICSWNKGKSNSTIIIQL